jgi:two-component system KDP operon response regulator KdpE
VDELQPDLVVLVPPEDEAGLQESCETARALTEAPLVVLSSRDQEPVVTRALAAGVDEYFVLPMGDRELSARMEAMLRRMERNAALNATRRVGNLVLSATDHSVTRDGRKIFLSPIEFRLLACLASAPGKVLTHQTLMSRVWGIEYVDSRHYLRVYIRYLREKLEEDPNHPRLILSEWGVGYRLQVSGAPAPAQRPENVSRPAASYGLA